MRTRGFLRLLGSCFPLVLAFLAAAVLAAPAGPSFGPALGSDRAVSAAQQSAPAATVHMDADQPAAVPLTVVVPPRAAIAAGAPQRLLDSGSRALAAPRGPPHLFA
jgi:hypothetical protein